MKSEKPDLESFNDFDITDLRFEEVQFQENEIRREKSRKYGFLMKKPEEIELSEADKNEAIRRAINARKTTAYFKKIYSQPEPEKRLSARDYFDDFGKKYKISEQNEKIVKLLCYYFACSKKFEELKFIKNPSLKKGIMLAGGCGCGKTTLMRFFQDNQIQRYVMRTACDVSDQFAEDGSGIIKEYNKYVYCFDDLGAEDVRKHFGDSANVMAKILYNRYERGILTHVTTNLTANQIKSIYGERIASKSKGMFNIIEFPQDAKDLRV